MYRFAAALACFFAFCEVVGAGPVHATPPAGVVAPHPDRDARFRDLCVSLSRILVAHNARIEAEHKARKAADDSEPQWLFGQLSLDNLAKKQSYAQDDVREFAQVLTSMAVRAPGPYRVILADAALRTALFDTEKAFGVPIFATAESNKAALELTYDLEELTVHGLVPEEKLVERTDGLELPWPQRQGLKTSAELADTLRAVRALLSESGQTPVPRFYAARQLREVVMFVSSHLTTTARAGSTDLIERVMQYMTGQSPWFAYDLLRYIATATQPDHALAARLGQLYIRQFCAVPADAPFTCLNALSFLSLHYHSLHQEDELKLAQKRLAEALDGNEKLRLLMQSDARQADEANDRLSRLRGELESVVTPFGARIFADSDPEQAWAKLQEWRAMSYWVVNAAHGQRDRLMVLVAPHRKDMGGDEEMNAMALLGGGFVTALELGDTRTALESVGVLRILTEEMIQSHGPIESADLAKVRSMPDVMELGALTVAKQWKNVERLAQRIQANMAPFRTSGRKKDGTVPCAPRITVPSSFVTGNGQDYFEDLFFTASQLEFEAAIHLKKSLPLARIRELFEHDVLELLRPPPEDGVGFGFHSNQDEKRHAPLSPADFLVNWPRFSIALERHGKERIAFARVAKCLLARPEFKPSLATAVVNANAASRALLGDALDKLLDDSGTVDTRGGPLPEDDFQLLQIAAILQANNGISAATARAVFADEKTRERVRRAEAGMSQLRDRLTSFRDVAVIFNSDQWSGPADLLEVATANPAAYERYEELKQQSTVTLKELSGVLHGGEAAVLFVPVEKRLLAVVIRPERATLVKINVPRPLLRAQADQLLASLRFSAKGGRTLPAPFRADVGWSLYRTIVRPLEKELTGQTTIYLIGGDELSRIPFQALVTAAPPSQSRITFASYRSLKWLGDRYAFVSLPSVHALLRAGRKLAAGAGRLLGVGEPAVAIKTLKELRLDSMPETSRLLRRASKPEDHAPLLGPRANLASLADSIQNGKFSEADIVLINSHTLPAGEGEHYGTKEPAIVLAPSSGKADDPLDLLDSRKVMELNFSVRLVMLMACETAGGRSVDDPQPYAGLVNAFFFAGADTVLATTQPVDAVMTEDLAVIFLQQLRDRRLSSAVALQKAVANIRCTEETAPCTVDERAVRAHPAYWSHFILVGSGR